MLQYAVAICNEAGTWVASTLNYTQDWTPKALKYVALPKVKDFVSAQCIDRKLLVLHTDNEKQLSEIDVYDFYLDLEKENPEATFIRSYNRSSLYPLSIKAFIITSFEVVPADSVELRRLFFTQSEDYLITQGINVTDGYSLISIAPF